jgi:hypothetical protein
MKLTKRCAWALVLASLLATPGQASPGAAGGAAAALHAHRRHSAPAEPEHAKPPTAEEVQPLSVSVVDMVITGGLLTYFVALIGCLLWAFINRMRGGDENAGS